MSSRNLIRWAGLAGAIGGVLIVATDIVTLAAFFHKPPSVVGASSAWFITLFLEMVAAYLAFLALVGLYARQTSESGAFGFTSFIVASFGTALNIGLLWAGTFLVHDLAAVAPAFLDSTETTLSAIGAFSAVVILAIGWTLFGIASLRAKVLPALPSWLLVFGASLSLVLTFTGLPLETVVFGVALVWLGWWLWSGKGTSAD